MIMDDLYNFECGRFDENFFLHFAYEKLEMLIALIHMTFSGYSVQILF